VASDERMRELVAEWGLRVYCVVCFTDPAGVPRAPFQRHRPEVDGRLRRRVCPFCGWRSFRSVAWALRYRARASKLAAEFRQGETVFSDGVH